MQEILIVLLAMACLSRASPARAAALAPVHERFADKRTGDAPSFRRHVMPLLGRLGCNGRACHGSFQGQGGFRLSLFGYDFDADHAALAGGETPRIDRADPMDSRILEKPTLTIPHKGGKRFEPNGWQYHLLEEWIASGARNDSKNPAKLIRLKVDPSEIVFQHMGNVVSLRVTSEWSDGTSEDVTDLCRFSSNEEAVATVDADGHARAAGKGDTHLIVCYDNGITPVPVLLPSSNHVNEEFPAVGAPTRIDELVVAKLRRAGIVPSKVCTDAEFLRRITLDLIGSLPTPAEIGQFLADPSPDKRARKIDELLERPAYAAWWTTRLCDLTGNNGRYSEGALAADFVRQWYEWVRRRVQTNVGYDEIAAKILLAISRRPNQTFEDYSREMSGYYRKDHPNDYCLRETLPLFWSRTTLNRPEEKALAVSHTFLGIRLQCAQCHKHPFDQWTKQDFDEFAAFFRPVVYGTRPEDRSAYAKMETTITVPIPGTKDAKVKLPNQNLVREGKVIPWRELYVTKPAPPAANAAEKGKKPSTPPPAPPPIRAKLPGGDLVTVPAGSDPRPILVQWLLRPDNPYFARAFVNRVWANYFNVGIIEPPDDLSMANPPSNAALIDYLTQAFIEHHYDMKWLHREITNSQTYQRSWQTDETNRFDARNFSHALPRRLPAEVAYDAIAQATASVAEIADWNKDINQRVIGMGATFAGKKGRANYALSVFGKPDRTNNCDCERSNEPNLLQTLFMLNDSDISTWLDHKGGWMGQVGRECNDWIIANDRLILARADAAREKAARQRADDGLRKRIQELEHLGKTADVAALRPVLAKMHVDEPAGSAAITAAAEAVGHARPPDENRLIREAYLRTVSRPPSDREIARARDYFKETQNPVTGLRDLMWALLNTNEFIVNH